MSDTETKTEIQCLKYTDYRIPIYGKLAQLTEDDKNTAYYPVVATQGGSCIAIDECKYYVPIKVPSNDAVGRYDNSDIDECVSETLINACDLPYIDIRLLCQCDTTNKLPVGMYDIGTINYDGGSFTYSSNATDSLVSVNNLNNMLGTLNTEVTKYGVCGSLAFWTTPVQVTTK